MLIGAPDVRKQKQIKKCEKHKILIFWGFTYLPNKAFLFVSDILLLKSWKCYSFSSKFCLVLSSPGSLRTTIANDTSNFYWPSAIELYDTSLFFYTKNKNLWFWAISNDSSFYLSPSVRKAILKKLKRINNNQTM